MNKKIFNEEYKNIKKTIENDLENFNVFFENYFSFNKAEINNPKLLNEVFYNFTDGDYINKYKYISNKKLYNLKAEMEHYVERFCKSVKDGKINKSALEKFERKNLIISGINFAAGFAVAAAFLSTLIPKFQYWFTKKTTGVDAFPGVYEFEKEKK